MWHWSTFDQLWFYCFDRRLFCNPVLHSHWRVRIYNTRYHYLFLLRASSSRGVPFATVWLVGWYAERASGVCSAITERGSPLDNTASSMQPWKLPAKGIYQPGTSFTWPPWLPSCKDRAESALDEVLTACLGIDLHLSHFENGNRCVELDILARKSLAMAMRLAFSRVDGKVLSLNMQLPL
jgi:hypothetical protein